MTEPRPTVEPRVMVSRPAPAPECDSGACWEARAVAAVQRGELDVAAVLRGRAFVQAPSPERLAVWVDAWLACGSPKRARAALELARRDVGGDAAWVTAIEERLAALPADLGGASILPGGPTEALQRGYSEAAGAVLSAAGEREPYHLVNAAGLAWARGEEAQAPRLWARARAGYDARGATVQVDAVNRRSTDLLLWRGKQLLREEELSAKERTGEGSQALRWLGAKPPQRRLMFARKAQRAAIGDDGTLLRSEGNAVVVYDVVSGIALRRIVADDGDIEDFVTAGAGDAMRVLTRHRRVLTLWDAGGKVLARHPLGPWDPSPPVLALGRKGRMLAVSEKGPRIRVIDGDSGVESWVPFPAPPEVTGGRDVERRRVVALGFTAGNDGLVAVDSLGEIVTWDLPGGRLRRRVSGACSRTDLQTLRAGVRVGPVDAAARFECGVVEGATISAAGDTVAVTGVAGLRVRSARSGATLAMLGGESPGAPVFSSAGELAVSWHNLVLRWRPGRRGFDTVDDVGREPLAPADVYMPLARIEGGQVVVKRGQESQRWDIATGELLLGPRLAAGERVQATIDGGSRVWVRGGDAVTLRVSATGKELLRVPVAADGEVHVGEAGKGRALLMVAVADGWDHHVFGPEGSKVVRLVVRADRLSPDGRWLAVIDGSQMFSVWEVAGGSQVYAAKHAAVHGQFGGQAIAWRVPARQGGPKQGGEVRWRSLAGADAQVRSLELGDRALDLAVSEDGSEVIVLTTWTLVRWTPATGQWTEVRDQALQNQGSVAITGGGATLTVTDRGVQIFSNDAQLRLLASVVPLASGGWVALAGSGAVDGSSDAPDHLVTRVTRGEEALVFDGQLGWGGAFVPGLLARALAGEDVSPPGLVGGASGKRMLKVRRSDDGSAPEQHGVVGAGQDRE